MKYIDGFFLGTEKVTPIQHKYGIFAKFRTETNVSLHGIILLLSCTYVALYWGRYFTKLYILIGDSRLMFLRSSRFKLSYSDRFIACTPLDSGVRDIGL
jgi:hypothetical protein